MALNIAIFVHLSIGIILIESSKITMANVVSKGTFGTFQKVEIKTNNYVSDAVFVLCECPNGWNHYDNSCYRMSHDSETWLDAMDVCKLDNAYLVEITSARENNYIKSLTAARGVAAWTGGNDLMIEGQWTWVHSNQNISYTNWSTRQPDNAYKNENCMTIGGSGYWNDIACIMMNEYVCELPLGNPSEIIG